MVYQVKILNIIDETPDVKTFTLTKPHELKFIPGQFCMVSQENFDGERPFTFANAPSDAYIELTIKKMGDFTTRLFSKKAGDPLWITEARGMALNFSQDIKDNIVFLAGGSGITPCMSIMRYADIRDLPNKMILFYSNRTKKDIIFKSDFRHMKHKVILTLTGEKWKGTTGFIDKKMILKHIKDPINYLWYVCGPPPMVEAMKQMLGEMNISEDRWRIEPWELPGRGK